MRGRWLRRVGPWLTPALVVAEVALASSGLLPLREAVVSAVAVELALWVVVAARVVADAVADVLLFALLPGSAWRWAVLGAHVYALVVAGGLHASFATRPHLVVGGNLVVRDGIVHEIVIPLGASTAACSERSRAIRPWWCRRAVRSDGGR